jgi:hypothetical protein
MESKGGTERGVSDHICIHLFDLLTWLFGNAEGIQIDHYCRKKVSGRLEMQHVKVNWTPGINDDDLPAAPKSPT